MMVLPARGQITMSDHVTPDEGHDDSSTVIDYRFAPTGDSGQVVVKSNVRDDDTARRKVAERLTDGADVPAEWLANWTMLEVEMDTDD